ncbi:MAG: hypothetical protein ACN4GM_01985 [Gammaproteobacteria bacterium]
MSVAKEYMYGEVEKYGWSPSKDDDGGLLSRYEEKHEIPRVFKMPMYVFVSGEKIIQSNKPVEVTFSYEDNQYFASNDALDVFAYGDTIELAVEDFSQHIIYFYEFYLSKDRDECMGQALKLKELYDGFSIVK